MGMTLWIHTLEGRRYSRDSADHSWMHRLADELDAICAEEGVTRLSEFFDFTSLDSDGDLVDDFGIDPFDDEDDDLDEPELDDDDGEPSAAVAAMTWFEADEGLESLGAMLAAVQGGAFSELGGRETGDLVEELENCIKVLEDTATRGGKFHLAVVE